MSSHQVNSNSTTASKEPEASVAQHGEFEDCTPCRVMGAATFIGLGVYTLTLRPESTATSATADKARPFARAVARYAPQMRGGLGASFILLGVYRLLV